MKIQWLKKPKEDLRASFRYLAERNPDAAWCLREEVEKRVRVLTDNPKIAPDPNSAGAASCAAMAAREKG